MDRTRLKEDKQKRYALFKALVGLYPEKEKLVRSFNHKNMGDPSKDPMRDPALVLSLLDQIERLLVQEVFDAVSEEAEEAAVLQDLQTLNSEANRQATFYWVGAIKSGLNREAYLGNMIIRLHDVLTTELKAIRLIRTKVMAKIPSWDQGDAEIRGLILSFFTLVYHDEDYCYKAFSTGSQEIEELLRMVLLEEEIEEAENRDDERFAKEIIENMRVPESEDNKHEYRQLGEEIFCALFDQVGAPFSDYDSLEKGFEEVKRLMLDDRLMIWIISQLKQHYSPNEMVLAMHAFRIAFDLGHFYQAEYNFLEEAPQDGQT